MKCQGKIPIDPNDNFLSTKLTIFEWAMFFIFHSNTIIYIMSSSIICWSEMFPLLKRCQDYFTSSTYYITGFIASLLSFSLILFILFLYKIMIKNLLSLMNRTCSCWYIKLIIQVLLYSISVYFGIQGSLQKLLILLINDYHLDQLVLFHDTSIFHQ